jgi:hypothetical protein
MEFASKHHVRVEFCIYILDIFVVFAILVKMFPFGIELIFTGT